MKYVLINENPAQMKLIQICFLPLVAILGIASCESDDPKPVNEEELITTVIMTFQPSAGGTPVLQSFRDADGPGGEAPVVTTQDLAVSTVYSVTVDLLNESVTPAESISDEVRDEAVDHQLFFVISGLDLSFTYNDEDTNGHPVGLGSTCVTGAASNGTITVVLRHQPDKDAPGVSAGDITNAGGETDVEVTFELAVE